MDRVTCRDDHQGADDQDRSKKVKGEGLYHDDNRYYFFILWSEF